MNPQKQSEIMVKWFFDKGVSALDIHLRVPRNRQANYRNESDWLWITQHECLDMDRVLEILPWCRFKNRCGADIFVRPHRYHSQNLIFLDDLCFAQANKVAIKYSSLIVETSPKNTQVWMKINSPQPEKARGKIQQYLATLGYTDPGSISGEHLGRLCGFKSQKRNCWVNFNKYTDAGVYEPLLLSNLSFPQGGACAKQERIETSQSEKDFSWVLRQARIGIPKKEIYDGLLSSAQARGKPSPQKYTKRTHGCL
jgi:hypothetical protein